MLQSPIVTDCIILEEMKNNANVELSLIVQVEKQPELKTLKIISFLIKLLVNVKISFLLNYVLPNI